MPSRAPRRGFKWFAWWYASIGVGFILLGAYRMLAGEAAWLIALRFVIAAGFLALSALEFHGR